MRTYTFDCARDGDLFREEFICADREQAETMAVAAINAAWGKSIGSTYATWDDMASDMDGCDIIEHPAVMAPRITLSMLDWLYGMAREAMTIREGDDEDETAPETMEAHRETLREVETLLNGSAALDDDPFHCSACGRAEADCSAAPCPAVIADREA